VEVEAAQAEALAGLTEPDDGARDAAAAEPAADASDAQGRLLDVDDLAGLDEEDA
jgi:hypothetical protein